MNDCLILIDKPLNFTSNHVLQSIKKRLRLKKAGLVGVLDPLATGMLLIVTGEATKFSQYIENMTKGNFIELHGDRSFKDDKAMIGGWGTINQQTVSNVIRKDNIIQYVNNILLCLSASSNSREIKD